MTNYSPPKEEKQTQICLRVFRVLRLRLLNSISTKRPEGALENWLIPCLEEEMCVMSLEYLVLPDSKDANKDYKVPIRRTQHHVMTFHWPEIKKV